MERICKNIGKPVPINSKGYIWARDDYGYLIQEHRLVWEKAYGKIPEGYMIHHKNGNKADNDLKNLECVSRKEHGLRHRKVVRKIPKRKYNKISRDPNNLTPIQILIQGDHI